MSLVGTTLYNHHNHSDVVRAVAWSPDGKYVASASYDGTVQTWNALNGSDISIFGGYSNRVTAVIWSLDGTRIAFADYAKTVEVWDVITKYRVLSYRGHTDIVYSLAWSPQSCTCHCIVTR